MFARANIVGVSAQVTRVERPITLGEGARALSFTAATWARSPERVTRG
ncbi:MAG TPA: hypothetical protein VGJ91_05335 [Polyangiaceae bacterium]